ncbi:dephospho-CoA kinase [Bacteroidota bacterium]
MLKIGLTGSIGSGKTIVSVIFKSLGVKVYHADEVARNLLNESHIKDKIQEIFGNGIVGDRGYIDRKALAGIVFNNRNELEKLNSIIHPVVHEHFNNWLSDYQNEPYILHEAAILFESGFNKLFDKVIMVMAPLELRINRIMERDGINRDEILQRVRNQWDDQKKKKLSDWIINNDEKQLVIPQVISIHKMFT